MLLEMGLFSSPAELQNNVQYPRDNCKICASAQRQVPDDI